MNGLFLRLAKEEIQFFVHYFSSGRGINYQNKIDLEIRLQKYVENSTKRFLFINLKLFIWTHSTYNV